MTGVAAGGAAAAPVRVLFCEANMDGTIGGSYYSLLYLTTHLDRARYEPLVVFHRDHALVPRFREAGVDVRVLPPPRRIPLPFQQSERRRTNRIWGAITGAVNGALIVVDLLRAALKWAQLLRRHRVGLVHLNNSVTKNHEWMLAASLTRTPCLTHERGINTRFSPLARLVAPRLAAVLCISRAVRDNLIEYGVTEANVHVVPNGLDPAAVVPRRTAAQVRKDYGIGDGRRVIALVGNIREWKGQEIVVRALPAIVSIFPDVVCLFVGDTAAVDEWYHRRLRDLISSLGLDRHVVFTGYCAHVADALNTADVAIHASTLPEPFGRVLLEAMAMRKPLVGSRSGAVPEIVEDGVTGYTFAPGNADELAACVIRLLEDPAMALQFGEAGFARLEREFHIAQNVERTMAVYGRVLARSFSSGVLSAPVQSSIE